MDSHGAFASELLRRANASVEGIEMVVDAIKSGGLGGVGPKMTALLDIVRLVLQSPRKVTREDVARATDAGASDADTQLAVLIAAAFCMYNRMVDGLRAKTPPNAEAFRARAAEIAEHGYSDPRVRAIPR
jgi:hypothetical protein